MVGGMLRAFPTIRIILALENCAVTSLNIPGTDVEAWCLPCVDSFDWRVRPVIPGVSAGALRCSLP